MSLDELITKLGKGKSYVVTTASADDSPCVVTEWLPTDCLALDTILGGGLPVGRIVEIYGDTSTGKSLIAAQCVAAAQAEGYICAYMDTERAVSLEIMGQVGVDTNKLIYTDPETIEEVFEFMEGLIINKPASERLLIVWDSIAATTVDMEKTAEYGKATMGKHAQLISQGLRKFNHLISKHNVVVLFLNQTRQKIGVMFGDNETTFGGNAVAFYSSVRVRLKKGKKMKTGKKTVGIETRAYIVKSKVAYPFGEATLPIFFGYGIDDAAASLAYLKERDGVEVSGAYHTINIDGKDIKFQSPGWAAIYDEHYEVIAEIMKNA